MIILARDTRPVPYYHATRRTKVCVSRWPRYFMHDGYKPERVFTLVTYTEQVGLSSARASRGRVNREQASYIVGSRLINRGTPLPTVNVFRDNQPRNIDVHFNEHTRLRSLHTNAAMLFPLRQLNRRRSLPSLGIWNYDAKVFA